jgi:hypothetical protein
MSSQPPPVRLRWGGGGAGGGGVSWKVTSVKLSSDGHHVLACFENERVCCWERRAGAWLSLDPSGVLVDGVAHAVHWQERGVAPLLAPTPAPDPMPAASAAGTFSCGYCVQLQ